MNNFTVLITRPKHQAEKLSSWLQKKQCKTLLLPTIEISSITLSDQSINAIKKLENFQIAIFTSRNAVIYAMAEIYNLKKTWPNNILVIAVGSATQNALTEYDINNVTIPHENFSSEGILALDALQSIKNKSIVIFSGENGRDILQNTLQDRGANIIKIPVYRRIKPTITPENLSQLLKQKQIDAIVITSNESLENFIAMLDNDSQAIMRKMPLVVLSKRIFNHAKSLGFDNIFVTRQASDDAILETILALKENIMARKSPITDKDVNEDNNTNMLDNLVVTNTDKFPMSGTTVMAVFAIILGVLAISEASIFGYHFMQSQNQQQEILIQINSQLQNSSAKIQNLEKNLQQLNDDFNQQNTAIEASKKQINELLTNKPEQISIWSLLETQRLVNLANLNLMYGRDIPSAIALLQNAKDQLSKLNNANFLSLTQSLADNILTLQNIPKTNITDIVTRISSLSQQINTLPLIPTYLGQTTANPTIEKSETKWSHGWRQKLLQSWQSVQQIIVIRHQSQPITPLMSPQSQENLIRNIQFQLGQANWAVLHNDATLYQQSLQQAANWLKQYYVNNDPNTKSVLGILNDLQTINVNPTLPNLNETQNMIEKLLEEMQEDKK